MCIFCAAIPAVAAAGAAVHGKQVEARRRARETGLDQPEAPAPATSGALGKLPVPAITAAVVGALVLGSVLIHLTTPTS
jgi:hypothetical protein